MKNLKHIKLFEQLMTDEDVQNKAQKLGFKIYNNTKYDMYQIYTSDITEQLCVEINYSDFDIKIDYIKSSTQELDRYKLDNLHELVKEITELLQKRKKPSIFN